MKYIVRKAYWDYEKEEKWLNEMSSKGMALTDYSWCRYVFMETPNNEYSYRIELLNNLPTHPESIAYIRFLEENGVECVATYMRWIYLRKKSSEGVFDLYSDIESKIKHYKRILVYWSILMWVELIIGFSNIGIGIVNMNIGSRYSRLGNFTFGNLFLSSLAVLLGLIFYILSSSIRKKIKALEREKAIRE